MRLVTDRSPSLQVRLHPIQEKVFSKDWGKKKLRCSVGSLFSYNLDSGRR